MALDFITHLSTTEHGHGIIAIFVDKITRRVRLVPFNTLNTAKTVTSIFLNNVFKLHDLADSFVLDRDPKFTSRFWKQLTTLFGIRLKMSTSRYTQTDGLTKNMNRLGSDFLRCNCNQYQRKWDVLLRATEFVTSSSIVAFTRTTPFKVHFGWPPKYPLDALSGPTKLFVQNALNLRTRLATALKDAQFSTCSAQARQDIYNGKLFNAPTYKVGEDVFLSQKLFTTTA